MLVFIGSVLISNYPKDHDEDFKVTEQTNSSEGLTQRIREAIETIRPYLQADGGDIEFVELAEGGVVKVRLQGACKGCPSAAMTLKSGVERHLKEKVPEVTEVVAV